MRSTVALITVVALLSALSPSRCDQWPWMNTSATPSERAQLLLSQMTTDEKFVLIHGTPGPYQGNTPPIERLGVPGLNIEDGPQGVSDGVRNVTCWPSTMTVVSSFDTNLLYNYGQVIAKEQRKKGTNVMLGPMINMARVPQYGRNFESMGEDPYLTGEMAYWYIKGAQEQGIIACAKHNYEHNQEYNSTQVSVESSQRTLMEMYVPHFLRSLQAGVGSFMCAYNKINGTFSCENNEILNVQLKGWFGFEGWVMSDWFGTHSSAFAANSGLDQEMPNSQFFGDALKADLAEGKISIQRIDNMVLRILTQMFKFGLFDRPQEGNLTTDARSQAHTQMARLFAAYSTVLVKNEGDLLPVKAKQYATIGIVGDAGNDAPVYAGGGSGQVFAEQVVTPLQAFRTKLAGTSTQVRYANTTQTDQVEQIAQQCDIVFVFVGMTSTEGGDRPNLQLPDDQQKLIRLVTQLSRSRKTVVVMNVPGATLMPWLKEVNSVLIPFFPGQEDGNAIADIIFGDINPAARLPITFPAEENQVPTNTPIQYPGIDNVEVYSEGLDIGYRWYDRYGVKPLFAFGHGLSYTKFQYNSMQVTGSGYNLTITVNVTNTGKYDGAEVVQLYLAYPLALAEPPKQLKGFAKIGLKVGESGKAVMTTTAWNFQFWNTTAQKYDQMQGTYVFMVGSSSADIRLQQSCIVSEFDAYCKPIPTRRESEW